MATLQPSAELLLMLLADARLPSGGHTQSGGLEPALRDGLRVDDVPEYLQARLITVTAQTAALAVVARNAVVEPELEAAEVIAAAWKEWAARTPSDALRHNEEQLGRGYRRVLEFLWGGAEVLDEAAELVAGYFRTPTPLPPRAIVLGVVAANAGLSSVQTARLVGYDDVQTVVSACLKLEPIDPMQATRWTLTAFNEIETMARIWSEIVDPAELPARSAQKIEEWAQTHAAARERLFSA